MIIYIISAVCVTLLAFLLLINQQIADYRTRIGVLEDELSVIQSENSLLTEQIRLIQRHLTIVKIVYDDDGLEKYEPEIVHVDPGVNSTVLWVNESRSSSSVISNDQIFASDLISPGNSWLYRFEEQGEYGYHSEPHPWMSGKVIVTKPNA